MEGLCRFPYVDLNAHMIFSYLLDQFPEFICEEPTLTTVLLRLEKAIESRLAAEPGTHTRVISQEAAQIRRITRRQSASPVKETQVTPPYPSDSPFLRVGLI